MIAKLKISLKQVFFGGDNHRDPARYADIVTGLKI
jgi:hypothetical protein